MSAMGGGAGGPPLPRQEMEADRTLSRDGLIFLTSQSKTSRSVASNVPPQSQAQAMGQTPL